MLSSSAENEKPIRTTFYCTCERRCGNTLHILLLNHMCLFLDLCVHMCQCVYVSVCVCVSVCMCQCVCLSTCNKGQSRSVRVLDFWWSLTLLELLIDDIQNMNHYQTFVYIILSHNIYSGTLFSLIVPPDICRFDKYESSM